MKKVITVFLLLVMSISLFACNHSRATAKQTERLNSVVTLIEAIGNVTYDSEIDIVTAEQAYANLSDEEKKMIPDAAKVLNDCRNEYESIRAKHMAAKAAEVSDAIKAIGTVTLESSEIIQTVRMQYDALANEEKDLVTSYSTLIVAEAEYQILRKNHMQSIISEYSENFNIDTDPVDGVTWYTHKNMPKHIDSRSYIIPYIGIKDSYIWLCVRYNYTGNDWVFWDNLTILVDDQKYPKYAGYFDVTRNNDNDVWEYWDEVLKSNLEIDSDELKMLQEIADSEETIVRFRGDEYYYDLYVTEKDKKMIQDTLTLYEALLG